MQLLLVLSVAIASVFGHAAAHRLRPADRPLVSILACFAAGPYGLDRQAIVDRLFDAPRLFVTGRPYAKPFEGA